MLILFIFFSCCTSNSKKDSRIGDHVIQIDLDRNDKISINDILSEIEFIPLDNQINIGKNNLELPIEKSNVPYFFVLIGNNVQHVFMPDKSNPEYTNIYLKEIKKRYFNRKSLSATSL